MIVNDSWNYHRLSYHDRLNGPLRSSENCFVGVAKQKRKNKPMTMFDSGPCDWLVLLLLLPTPTTSRSCNQSHKGTHVKLENGSRKRSHKLDGIGVGRISRTFQFLPIMFTTLSLMIQWKLGCTLSQSKIRSVPLIQCKTQDGTVECKFLSGQKFGRTHVNGVLENLHIM